jgi:hypothetical protein
LDDAVAAQARREIADCDAKLRQHRAALEAGADPQIVTGWMAETQAQRAIAESRLSPGPQRSRLTREEITQRLAAIGDVTSELATADPADKASLYGQLGLSLTYHPDAGRGDVEARPLSVMYVKECLRSDTNQIPIASPLRMIWQSAAGGAADAAGASRRGAGSGKPGGGAVSSAR